jgi:hypothetical protein
VEALLAAALANYSSIYESLIVYKKRIVPTPPPGATVAAVEGDQRPDGPGPNTRFAFAAIESGPRRAVLTFLIPSTPDFLKLVKHVIATMRLAADGADTQPGPGMQRAHANFVHMDLPADWQGPDTLGFFDRDSDRVSLRVTIAERPSPEGTIDLSAEVPGNVRVIASATEPAEKTVPGSHGWDGEWTVEGAAGEAARLVVRKAVLQFNRGQTVTVHGQAPAALAPVLAGAWRSVRSTMHSVAGHG